MKNIVFMGTPDYASVILEAILKNGGYNVVAVFTQPDRPVGRKAILTPPEVKKTVLQSGLDIPIFQPLNLKDSSTANDIKALKPDFIVVAAYGQILPKDILDIAPCINLHASLLPKFRGASPIQEAILRGELLSGVTAMRMGVGLDDGDMLGFSAIDISNLKSDELFCELAKMAANLTIKILDEFNNISPIKQFNALSSKCTKIKKEDGLINLKMNAKDIYAKFRAFYPWPGIFLENQTKILEMRVSNLSGSIGEILRIDQNGFVVGVNDGSIEINVLQEAGKKSILAKDYINGKRLSVGSKFC
ncbi:methionyl-tRNA formyltransferase [Campylobacter fetus]|uniref:Methionyl-tRNA formyltransferase n=1 Tax=Campylobacter fetus subsp. testudinum TaxID=1507806 RepID=A0AAX0HCD0_CAMFE|nr:methionyl-tRNA formyltransferase [Campylobacter fetus]AGZ82337.1 10-formyltetrahydrofolate:L-methionyl-tRNA(fMet) N-formyltransferase [Campylobacter fetus subsp. testudinum 03-427]AJB46060.1 methionyl-tRNA formyltransferase [Campylobacter fetus subsp. testudinum]EAI4322024.1 methionyl-tRNA formyltransferase [Campylobacter fetus]EAI4391658.1 methionyl-tRNA formyltransferase [Campylobacter fetus]EAK0829299.1 methionyl-tRNA formyltransferase [Campylobacter fetus]